jgi:hypothetical protein
MHFPCSHLITRTVSANEKLNPKCDFYLLVVVKNNRYSEPKGFPACLMHYSAFYLIVTANANKIWLPTSELFIASLSEGPQDVEGANSVQIST